MEEEVYCKSTYPQVPHWYPEEKVIFSEGTKYKLVERNEKYVGIIGDGGRGIRFYFTCDIMPSGRLLEGPIFEHYFCTIKELRKLKLKKIANER